MEKKALIEYLYLDLETCDRCIGTDKVLDEVVAALTPAIELAGFCVEYEKVEMTDEETAKQYEFVSSPTIRVNGRDICSSASESDCGCCGEISGTDVDCRVFRYEGKDYEVPPAKMLAELILKTIFFDGDACCCGSYELPENLKRFYEGKRKAKGKGIVILGTGCAKCNALEEAVKAALEKLGSCDKVEHVTDYSQIAAYGVMTTPALVVDGKVVSLGKVLKADEVVELVEESRR